MINLGIFIYLNDILIYSENEDDLIAQVKGMLARHQEHNLAIGPEKCQWHKLEVNLLHQAK